MKEPSVSFALGFHERTGWGKIFGGWITGKACGKCEGEMFWEREIGSGTGAGDTGVESTVEVVVVAADTPR